MKNIIKLWYYLLDINFRKSLHFVPNQYALKPCNKANSPYLTRIHLQMAKMLGLYHDEIWYGNKNDDRWHKVKEIGTVGRK